MKKFAFALALVMLFAFAAFAGPMPGGTKLIFSTGGAQGTYYGFGGVLAGKVGETTSTQVTAITSGGSKANIEAMDDDDAQLGFVQTDVGAYAYKGMRLFEEKIDNFSTVANLYMEQVQIVTLDPKIRTVADLKGKVVSVGAAGSGVYFNAVDVLKAYGLDIEKDIQPTYQSFGDSVEALQDGKIDAGFIVAGAPTTAITSLSATKKVYLVSFDDEHILKLIADSPYYSKNVIAKEVYGTDEDVTTVAVGAVVIARDDVREADVYNFLYGIFENKDAIAAAHAKGNDLDLNFAVSYTAVPYHPGAIKYFAEKGLNVTGK
ncbi:MAG: TAXI family TRAP transporter solute-binding subunit [Synergistaceae bacterium]|nr:TAXI family TRAP transporter solute-binding subunit [Synergistaceae bacterium]MBQ4418501.1 TAXI family TRAP transporter solute-binding subunit [Synergistaceae bacterium]MBQ7569992.1 TAXI family TRAP transporter solute-binding subunit [Synergistaceae bacterium]MBR0096038.1 TAXI family TRAP transporter solute-binding subunit [Synergistaceae bacterium]MBR0222074.1 TAXI family TRAP transporter solute-binding subunit [Synergistaceae bacterium]